MSFSNKSISILKNKKKAVRILSIDGGGVKGIIPARIVVQSLKIEVVNLPVSYSTLW